MRWFMFIPLAVVMAIGLGAAAGFQDFDGGVNQEGSDDNLKCARSAEVHWVDEWRDKLVVGGHTVRDEGFYKIGAKVYFDGECDGLKAKLVLTHDDEKIDGVQHAVIHDGKAEFDWSNLIPSIPVWKVTDVHVLVYTPCDLHQIEPNHDCDD